MRDEADWIENEVEVSDFDSKFLAPYNLHLEQATKVEPLEYRWKLGRKLALLKPHHPKRLSRQMEEVFTL